MSQELCISNRIPGSRLRTTGPWKEHSGKTVGSEVQAVGLNRGLFSHRLWDPEQSQDSSLSLSLTICKMGMRTHPLGLLCTLCEVWEGLQGDGGHVAGAHTPLLFLPDRLDTRGPNLLGGRETWCPHRMMLVTSSARPPLGP